MTRDKAHKTMLEIRRFWNRRGCKPELWIEREPKMDADIAGGEFSQWTVRSDMRNGLPRDATDRTVRDLFMRPAL